MKECMITGEGSTIILHDIGNEPQDTGFMFILRYLIYLLATFDEINRDIDAERFAIRNFAHYVRKVERHGKQSVSNFFEPAIPRLAKVQQRLILEDMVDQMDIFLSPDVLNSVRDRPQAQLPVTYTGSCLHKSFAESLRIHNGDITQGDRIHRVYTDLERQYKSHIKVFNPRRFVVGGSWHLRLSILI